MAGGLKSMAAAGAKALSAMSATPGQGAESARLSNLGMSGRQMALNALWAWYNGEQYSERKWNWDGFEVMDVVSTASISNSGSGAWNNRNAELPLRFRRPTAPYHLATVITDRFTGLLFTQLRHPKLLLADDEALEQDARSLAKHARLWPQMVMARTMGGAMGSVALGFKFVDGQPHVEVHDPRWCTPTWKDRDALVLSALDKRYMYVKEERAADTGRWEQNWYWYRREITEEADTLWDPVEVGNGEEPDWARAGKTTYTHGYGFCPAVWVQNTPDLSNDDGQSDYALAVDQLTAIDALLSQANKGTIANSDPTLVMSLRQESSSDIKKGSDNALVLYDGEGAAYLELTGSGAAAAIELAMRFRTLALEVCRCVLDHPSDGPQRTATEIERVYSTMLGRADTLREQYGQRGVVPLMSMMLKVVGMMRRGELRDEAGNELTVTFQGKVPSGKGSPQTELSPGAGVMELEWGPYFEPSASDALQAVQAAGSAKEMGLIDTKHAVEYVANYFGVKDPTAMLEGMEHEAAEAAAEQLKAWQAQLGGGAKPPVPPRPNTAKEDS